MPEGMPRARLRMPPLCHLSMPPVATHRVNVLPAAAVFHHVVRRIDLQLADGTLGYSVFLKVSNNQPV